MKTRIIGVSILVVIIATALAIFFFQGGGKKQVTLKGLVGGEKKGFLEDDRVKDLLKKRYGVTLDFSVAGSIEMVKEEGTSDFLFPSSQIALELFKETKGQKIVKSENVFNSPIVFYSWDIVTQALIKQGIVQQKGTSYYIVDLPKLIEMVSQGKKWSDIGLGDIYGSINIISTDPTKSNSGNMFYGLLAGILNGEALVDDSSVNNVTEKLKKFYDRSGYLEHSSSALFERYLTTGVGENPIIVGYENQVVEFALENQELWKRVKDKVNILYPEPTVWSSHQLIALNSKANILIEALQDKDIQKLAWESHGFRTGLSGFDNDTKAVKIVGIPEKIDKVMRMPSYKAMDKIMQVLGG